MARDALNPLPDPASLPEQRTAVPQPPQLPLPRFGLRQLLVAVAVVCALMAAIFSSNGMMAIVLLLASLVVTLHVASTALGTRLRAHADQQQAWETAHGPPVGDRSAANAVLPAEVPLCGRRSTLRWLPLLVAAGALAGLCAGAVLLEVTIGNHTSTAGIVLGSVSLGVVGGWLAFLGTSFWTILRQGWREALAHQRQDEERHISRR
jgi:hypothetical protein